MADRSGAISRLMPRHVYMTRRSSGRNFLFLLRLLVMIGCINNYAVVHATPGPLHHRKAQSVPAKQNAEMLLIDIYQALAYNRLREATAKADHLVANYPNFRLGHLLRGDLLMMHARQVSTFGATSSAPPDRLKEFREEAAARLRSLRERPGPGQMPRALLHLRNDQRHVFLVDTKRSRLYVYENQYGKLKLAADYYVTHGKSGIHKFREGDKKTPIGVYYVTARVPGARLPDFFGSGALPLNYPNEWDKFNGRSGSGIWLHGTSSDTFSRPPLASDGCVVLANPDIDQLYNAVDVGKTPVIIAEYVEFVSPSTWNAERTAAAHLLERWRKDVENADAGGLITHYSRQFKSANQEDLRTWLGKQARFGSSPGRMSVELKDVSQFFYPGRNDLIVSTFALATKIGNQSRLSQKRQYWLQEGAHWKIIYEENV